MEQQIVVSVIKQQLKKLTQSSTVGEVSSLVFFDINKEKLHFIKEIVFKEFSEIEFKLKSARAREIAKLQTSSNWVGEKIIELRRRYNDLEASQFISEHEEDLRKAEQDRIEHTSTELKILTDELELVEIDLNEYFLGKKRFEELCGKVDFYRLRLFFRDEHNNDRHALTDEEREYVKLYYIDKKIRNAKYVFCYNIDLQSPNYNFEFLLHSLFKWDRIKWSTFCFSITKTQVSSVASNFVNSELQFKRIQFE
ncbi:hypothetical protein [Hymenobacter cheonanensis]|uniref:hypothetical protein n=1 Tax=Hymenobacter sp. CA2-7 TaxID=3063993 RepID=UPI0027130A8B|nr:hypothetical protein [Hymenobacter sp. CA2-7]MDO7885701.1 hypothetical protein [Hymenobacter sp. CA2-7]